MRSIVALTCVLGAMASTIMACSNDEARPARDPSAVEPAPAIAEPVTTTTTTSDTTVLPAAPRAAAAVSDDAMKASPSAANAASAPPPAGEPSVASNPGVADGTKNADNTRVNDRDRHGALTPMDQGNSRSETQITADVRKSVMSDKSLSFTAKNVKIITVGSKVTLRGPVKSDNERAAIEARAKQVAGVTEVDNQLEVKK